MLPKLKENLLPSSRIAVGIVAAVLFVLGILQVVQGFIDTHNYRDEIIAIVKAQTGRDMTIKGKVTISLLPTPTIYLPGVELRATENDNSIPSITVDMIRLNVPFSAIFSNRPSISGITLDRPSLEIERAEDHLIHWDWLNAGLLKALANDNNTAAPSLEIRYGKIIYHNNRTDKGTTIDNLRASITAGSRLGAKGSFATSGHDFTFSFETNSAPGAGGPMPFTTQLHAKGKDALQWQGTLDLSGDVPKIIGKFNLTLGNILDWINVAAPVKKDQKTLLPINITGDWAEDGLTIEMMNVTFDGLNSNGAGKMSLAWKEWQPSFITNMGFTTFDYDPWQTLFTALSGDKPASTDYSSIGTQLENPLPKDIEAQLSLTADQLMFGGQNWKNVKLSAALADAALTVNHFTMELPGQSSLTLFGIISQGAAGGGMRFEGSMETSGKSLRETLTALDESAATLPETGFGDFYIRSNIFVSSEQVRLSEADVKINGFALTGGLVAYFDVHPRIEADVKLKDINFDYFRNVWRDKQKEARAQNSSMKFGGGINFDWLNKLKTTIDFTVNVNGFTFMDRKGNSSSFRIFVKQGEFGLYDIRLNYPDEIMAGGFTFNVSGAQPQISLIVNADNIDMGYFTGAKNPVPPGPPAPPPLYGPPVLPPLSGPPAPPSAPVMLGKWPETLIDTSWLEGYNGKFDLSIGKLTYGKTIINQLKFQATLANNLLTFQNFTFDYWQGRCSILGALYGGEVPGISLSFTLYNIELHDMLKELVGRENIVGKASINGTVTTSGVNPLSWVEQSDAKFILAGRGVEVGGLNLQGVVDAVAVSRTAADVLNNVNLALVNGMTEFSVDGNLNLKNGIIKTPGITLKSGTIIGDLIGEIQMVPWTMQLSTLFQFPGLTSETTPTMTVQLAGPVATAELKTDTASLEAYVAKRIISK